MTQVAQRPDGVRAGEASCPMNFASLAQHDPYAFYEALRVKGPIVWDDTAKGWLITSHALCTYVETNEPLFRHPWADADEQMIQIKGGRRGPNMAQGAEHTKIHRFVLGLFTPKNVAIYSEQYVRPIVHEILGRFSSKGHSELVSEFASLVPARVMMSLLNMPVRDDDFVRHIIDLHATIMNWVGLGGERAKMAPLALAASSELTEVMLPYVRARQKAPGNDLISEVWRVGPTVLNDFSETDALAICRDLFMGGSDTSSHLLANALYVLLTNPELMNIVIADRDQALSNFIEETLRIYGAVQYRPRYANQDCEVGGIKIKKNELLIALNSAANRDPGKYASANTFDLGRSRPRDHVAFNTGPRTCVGAALVRAEMVEALGALLDCTANLRMDPDKPKAEFAGHMIRSFRPIHVLFDPQ
jgi:cytochrome P450